VVTTAASGRPLPMPLAMVTMSGITPWFSKPQKWDPVRPNPVCTSSAIHTPPAARMIWWGAWRRGVGGSRLCWWLMALSDVAVGADKPGRWSSSRLCQAGSRQPCPGMTGRAPVPTPHTPYTCLAGCTPPAPPFPPHLVHLWQVALRQWCGAAHPLDGLCYEPGHLAAGGALDQVGHIRSIPVATNSDCCKGQHKTVVTGVACQSKSQNRTPTVLAGCIQADEDCYITRIPVGHTWTHTHKPMT
jgi:hypothetical protein